MRGLSKYQVLTNAKGVVRSVYGLGKQLPSRESFGLRSQMERASVSIAANIGEGLGRPAPGDVQRFLDIASASAAELSVLLDLAADVHMLDTVDVADRLEHVRRQLNNLTKRVRAARREQRRKTKDE